MIAVVDYGICNVRSVTKAFEAIGAEVIQTACGDELRDATHIVLPGVGAFREGMSKLKSLGLVSILHEEVYENGKPFLGICLGAQMTADIGFENGEVAGLGWLEASVRQFDDSGNEYRVPHMGWNDVAHKERGLFEGIKNPAAFYFVHSYFVEVTPSAEKFVEGTCFHGIEFTAGITKKNINLVQFHPEKSQKEGLQILENFLSL